MRSKKGGSAKTNFDFYFTLLQKIKAGKRPAQISKEFNLSKQNIYYYTRILRDLGFIKKKGYGVWEVLQSKREHLEHGLAWRDKKIRGHAVIWKVKPTKKFDWKSILEKKNIHYNLVRGYTPRLFIKNRKVWLGKESITIYETKSFYGKNAIESRKYAVYELKTILEALEKKLGISLGRYVFKPSREHFGMIKNSLAQQCNKNGEKIIVRDNLDGEWLWIDDSDGMMGELETGGKGVTRDRTELSRQVQNWYNDHKKHNFKVTPTFLMENINQVVENQKMFNENLSSHVKSVKDLGNSAQASSQATELLAETIKDLKEEVLSLRNEVKELKKEKSNN